jgi:hypothetical protein
MFTLFDVQNLPAVRKGSYSSVEEAVRAAKEMGLTYFYVFPNNGGSYSYCSF